MKSIIKFALTVLLMSVLSLAKASNQNSYGIKFVDSLKKEFTVSNEATINLDTKYGKINIIEGNSNVIKVLVNIQISTNKQKHLGLIKDALDVNIWQIGNTVYGSTNFGFNAPFSVKNLKFSYRVNYTIEVPKNIDIKIEHRYGNIEINTPVKSIDIDLRYGNIITKKILNENNIVNLAYGNITTDYVENLELNVAYGKAHLNEVLHLNIDEMKYSKLYIERLVKTLLFNNMAYSRLEIESCSNEVSLISGTGRYTPMHINIPITLKFKFKLGNRYGSIDIDNNINNNIRITNFDKSYNSTIMEAETKTGVSTCKIELNTTYSGIEISEQ